MQEFIITGTEVTALAEVDTITKQLMRKKNIPGGAVAIVKDNRLVFARGYTYNEGAIPYIQPTSLFRIASSSKPITKFAITLLLGDDLDRKVAPILNLTPPPGKTIKSEYKDVTVRHLLNHTSGLSNGGKGDLDAAAAFGISLPVNKYQAAAEIITEDFRFPPGKVPPPPPPPEKAINPYSNYGYAFLCLVIEKLTGSTYETYVKDAIFRAVGVKRPFVGRSLLSERAPGEVVYHDAAGRMDRSSVHADSRQVNICYGHMNMQNQAGFGGWVLSAPDYARIISAYGPISDFNLGGYFTGTLTWVMYLQSERVGIVALFNKDGNGIDWDDADPKGREYSNELKKITGSLTKSKTKTWPAHNLFNSVDIPFRRRSWVDSDLSAFLNAPSGSRPMGYIRADSVTSVIFTEGNDHIREFALKGGKWQHFDLTKYANAPTGSGAQGNVRADGVTTVVYRDSKQHIHELSLPTGKWQDADMTADANAPAVSSGFQHRYVRGDGVTSTVYTGSDKHIHELVFEKGKWKHYDLTNAATNAAPALYGPWGYMRSDDVTAVIYPGNDQHIHELALQKGKWVHSDLTADAKAAPIKSEYLMGYVRADGCTSVPYLATDGHIHELVLEDGKWHQVDLTKVANAAPILSESQARPWGYVRADRVSAVVYRGADNYIYELSLPGEQWQSLDLTKTTKAPSCASSPMGYVRADGVTAVVYQASDGHIHEMALQ